MDSASFFDNLAPVWDDNEVLSTPEKINHILDIISFEKNQSVLDLGTGTGVLLPFIAQRIGPEGKITAVDFSKGMLERAKQKYSSLLPKPEFILSDFENENIEGDFDRIILYCVYPHLHTPVDTLRWLSKVNLKKNGIIAVAFPCSEEFINNIHKERHSESECLPSASRLANYLRQNGLEAKAAAESNEAFVITITNPET